MDKKLYLGLRKWLLPIPAQIWRRQIKGEANLEFMTPEHHMVREFVVRELPQAGKPLTPARIAESVNMDEVDVLRILDELEKKMTFLYRDEQGAVLWAYPVTAAQTPHRVTFSSGERISAA
jgi:hypothetical protein